MNHASAIKVLQTLRQSNPELGVVLQVRDFLTRPSLILTSGQRLRDDPTARNLDLSSYLLVPSMFILFCPVNDPD